MYGHSPYLHTYWETGFLSTVQGFFGALKKVVSPKCAFVAMRAARDKNKRTPPRMDHGWQRNIHTFDDMDHKLPRTNRRTDSATETYRKVRTAWHQRNIDPTCYLYRIPSHSICEQLLSKLFQRSLCPKDLCVLPNIDTYPTYSLFAVRLSKLFWRPFCPT